MMPPYSPDSMQLISILLSYPDKTLFSHLDEIISRADQVCPDKIRSAIQTFIHDYKAQGLVKIQERYTALFDMEPSTTLNITYHAHGDNEKRAAALVQLEQSYARAGWERSSGELPDYLPMMLEFLAISPLPEHTAPVWLGLKDMEPLVKRLEKSAPLYGALLKPIITMAIENSPPKENALSPTTNKAEVEQAFEHNKACDLK